MNISIFLNFIYNVSLILAASVIYMLLPKKHFEPKGLERYFYGAAVSVIGIIIMSNPYVVSPGIQFDARSLIVAISAMFLGFIPTAIVTALTSAYRLIMGGDGAIVGVMVILSSAVLGSLWRILFYRKLAAEKRKRFINLYLTGLIVHIAYLLCLIALPDGRFMEVFIEVHLTLLIVYPIGLLILGLVQFSQYDKFVSMKELEDTKDKLYTYIEEAPYGIFILNGKGRFIDANKKALEISGYSFDELISLTTMDITSSDNTEENLQSFTALRENGAIDINKRYITKNNEIRTWNIRAVRLSEDMYVSFANDITDILRIEDENRNFEVSMRNQQKLESIGILAGGVAHEINNPINGIINYGQLILDSEDAGSEVREYAGEIIFESNRIAGIVKNLLSFSRQDETFLAAEDIRTMLLHTITLIKTIIKKDQITLDVCIDENLPEILCLNQQVQQVIMNLLTNARDALNEKYKGYHENKVMKISCQAEDYEGKRVIAIRIRDNGNGINKEISDRIFDPFFTTKERNIGTGLGLAISYGIIKEHGGEIGFTTKEGEFTEFFILLPIFKD